MGDRNLEADVLGNLGETHLAADDVAAAREAWQRAFDILDELDHPDAETVRAKIDSLATGPA